MNVIPLLSKPYVNWVNLTEQNLSSKRCQSLEQNLCLQTGQDLSKEVLWVSVGQRALELPAVKVEGLTKDSAIRPESNQASAARVRVLDDWIIQESLTDLNFAAL